MPISQYYLNWDSHKNNICNGFTNLQQNEEFVDMTLAADGHLVNVHKSVFALASPYIKTMLQSTPTPHPVVFLSNISHEVLTYIITYVYTGEVSVEVDKMQPFIRAAKDLQLYGLSSMAAPKVTSEANFERFEAGTKTVQKNSILNLVTEPVTSETITNSIQMNTADGATQIFTNNTNIEKADSIQYAESSDVNHMEVIPEETGSKGTANERMINSADNRQSGLYMTSDGYQFKLEIPSSFSKPPDLLQVPATESTSNVFKPTDIKYAISDSIVDQNNIPKIEIIGASLPNNMDRISGTSSSTASTLDPKALTPEYTMSSRGCLQLILNRYMYYCHHQSQGGRKRRWRCIDYRKSQCPAFIDTVCEIMTIRKFVHVHSFHDDKISKKRRIGFVTSNLNCVIQKINTSKSNES